MVNRSIWLLYHSHYQFSHNHLPSLYRFNHQPSIDPSPRQVPRPQRHVSLRPGPGALDESDPTGVARTARTERWTDGKWSGSGWGRGKFDGKFEVFQRTWLDGDGENMREKICGFFIMILSIIQWGGPKWFSSMVSSASCTWDNIRMHIQAREVQQHQNSEKTEVSKTSAKSFFFSH